MTAIPATPIPCTLLRGDGIGPEIVEATLEVLAALGAPFEWHEQLAGLTAIERDGDPLPQATIDSMRATGLTLKGPLTTPIGGGFRSINVRLREALKLYANVRPARSLLPDGKFPDVDIVLIRENTGGFYVGVEHFIQIGDDPHAVAEASGILTRENCQKIARYAFEYAVATGRKKITVVHKANILKALTGLFLETVTTIAKEYEGRVKLEDRIVDNCAMQLVINPSQFDMILTTNMFGDILSDEIAGLIGGLGLAPGANIGAQAAMFEAVHGSAPDIAGQDVANPSGLLLAGLMMLNHIGQGDIAAKIQNAWLCAIEDGVGTADIAPEGSAVGTQAFADAVIERLGRTPTRLKPAVAKATPLVPASNEAPSAPVAKTTVGVDLFVEWRGDAEALAERLRALEHGALELKMITNRGVKVWPEGIPETNCVDHWRCRFMNGGSAIPLTDIAALTLRAAEAGVDFIKTENLCAFDGEPGFSLGQGQ